MVTEIPGKGRGLVAAKNIKIGEVIFTDKPVTTKHKCFTSEAEVINDFNTFAKNFMPILEQVKKLPSEAVQQFEELPVPDVFLDCENSFILTYLYFLGNWPNYVTGHSHMLSLNFALVNHSCVPNVTQKAQKPDEEYNITLRAIKDISRGEEVTVSYLNDDHISEFGMNREKRREKLKKTLFFDCNCSFCSENPDWALYIVHWFCTKNYTYE